MKSLESMKHVACSPLSRLSKAAIRSVVIASGISSLVYGNTVAESVLNIGNGGILNVNNNTVIVLTPGAANTGAAIGIFGANSATYAQIASYVATGYNGGGWNGASLITGNITSGTANADASLLTSLGVVENLTTTTNRTSFGSPAVSLTPGATPGTGQALIKYTYYGDSNLDGAVTGADYSNIDNGFAFVLNGWFNGDFNYSGAVTGADYSIIDNAFAFQGPPLLVGDGGKGAGSVVPEPGSMLLLLVGAAGVLGRRKR